MFLRYNSLMFIMLHMSHEEVLVKLLFDIYQRNQSLTELPRVSSIIKKTMFGVLFFNVKKESRSHEWNWLDVYNAMQLVLYRRSYGTSRATPHKKNYRKRLSISRRYLFISNLIKVNRCQKVCKAPPDITHMNEKSFEYLYIRFIFPLPESLFPETS